MHATLSKAPLHLPTPVVSRGTLTDTGKTRLHQELVKFLNPNTNLKSRLKAASTLA